MQPMVNNSLQDSCDREDKKTNFLSWLKKE